MDIVHSIARSARKTQPGEGLSHRLYIPEVVFGRDPEYGNGVTSGKRPDSPGGDAVGPAG